MPAYFFDSSALVKCYVDETGSAWVRHILAPASGNDIHVLQIAELEITSAIVRRRKARTISAADALIALIEIKKRISRAATSFLIRSINCSAQPFH